MPLLGSLEGQGINVADNRTYLTNRTSEVSFYYALGSLIEFDFSLQVAQVGYFRTTFATTGVTTEVSNPIIMLFHN